ncbi:MAG: pyridoxamine 5'-phosphate oxidase [Bdellovibrionales bacterium CG10_big_fil_rev_8_21_14_0_10_45_34]|nr:MAG: pyridoxamine 5'-phosphate oxidase [Bdellovibrionales bacterium CG10_big_fil_rev_8_21_14_0_10_45_34]
MQEWFRTFEAWLKEASAHEALAEAFTLSTVDVNSRVDARVLLYKGLMEGGLSFVTNYDSAKGQQLKSNDSGAMTFHWKSLSRQVRVRGKILKGSADASDSYWKARPRGSQLSGYCSPQSHVISSRKELEQQIEALEVQYKGREIPRPENWGFYYLAPYQVEFWQGYENRFHERIQWRLVEGKWEQSLLAP